MLNDLKNKSLLLTNSLLGIIIIMLVTLLFISVNHPSYTHDEFMHNGNYDQDFMETMHQQHHGLDSVDSQRAELISTKQSIIGQLITQGDYTCCLTIPCTYCIEKTPGHGEGASCRCLDDVANGRHPCGECIGEVMEGHGNKFMAKYFARAIAEEVGEQHHEALKLMIQDKYDIPVIEQL